MLVSIGRIERASLLPSPLVIALDQTIGKCRERPLTESKDIAFFMFRVR